MMKTACCNAEIIEKHGREYPDGPLYSISTVAPACENCLEEHPETVTCCDICGEPSERFRHVNGDDYCPACFEERLQETIQQLRMQMGVSK